MNAFHVFGALFAAWAVVLSFIGITREDFPSTRATARLVGLVSVALAIATIGSAVYTSAVEDEEEDQGREEQTLIAPT